LRLLGNRRGRQGSDAPQHAHRYRYQPGADHRGHGTCGQGCSCHVGYASAQVCPCGEMRARPCNSPQPSSYASDIGIPDEALLEALCCYERDDIRALPLPITSLQFDQQWARLQKIPYLRQAHEASAAFSFFFSFLGCVCGPLSSRNRACISNRLQRALALVPSLRRLRPASARLLKVYSKRVCDQARAFLKMLRARCDSVLVCMCLRACVLYV